MLDWDNMGGASDTGPFLPFLDTRQAPAPPRPPRHDRGSQLALFQSVNNELSA